MYVHTHARIGEGVPPPRLLRSRLPFQIIFFDFFLKFLFLLYLCIVKNNGLMLL